MGLNNLTDQEKNLLLQLSYLDIQENVNVEKDEDSLTIKELLEYVIISDPKGSDAKRLENIKTYLEKESNLSNIKLIGYENHNPNQYNNSRGKSDSGFVGYAFEDNEGNATAIFRGSEFALDDLENGVKDWGSNAEHTLLGKEIQQQKEANGFYEKYVKNAKGQKYVMGHSKGGNLASYVYINNLDDKLRAYVLNAQPLYWFGLTHKQKEALRSEEYEFVVYEGDPVSTLGIVDYADRVVEVKRRKWIDYIHPFYPHSETNVEFNNDGSFKESKDISSEWYRNIGSNILWAELGVANKALEFIGDVINQSSQTIDNTIDFVYDVTHHAILEIIHAISTGTNEITYFIKEQYINAISRIKGVSRQLQEKIRECFNEMIENMKILWGNTLEKARTISQSMQSQLKVNTDRLSYYEHRLKVLKRQLDNINIRVDRLYAKVDINDLSNVARADKRTPSTYNIGKCIKYLNSTRNLLDQKEIYLLNKARSF